MGREDAPGKDDGRGLTLPAREGGPRSIVSSVDESRHSKVKKVRICA